jgi:hypothetical protein
MYCVVPEAKITSMNAINYICDTIIYSNKRINFKRSTSRVNCQIRYGKECIVPVVTSKSLNSTLYILHLHLVVVGGVWRKLYTYIPLSYIPKFIIFYVIHNIAITKYQIGWYQIKYHVVVIGFREYTYST